LGAPQVSKTPLMTLRHEPFTSTEGLAFLRHCYQFVQSDWQHLPRIVDLPDQGFERNFRGSCILGLNGWNISQEWELGLAGELETASGVRHEIDLVARHPSTLAVAELKNKPESPPDKNDVIVFFAKVLDYVAHNPRVLLTEALPVFMSSCVFEGPTLAACVGLGIHPVSPGLRPLPLLGDTLKRIDFELQGGLALPQKFAKQWEDACAGFNRLVLGLSESWMSAKCGYVSDTLMSLRATLDTESYEMSQELRQVNGDCSAILSAIRQLKVLG